MEEEFLNKLFEMTGGNTATPVGGAELVEAIGLIDDPEKENQFRAIAHDLEDRGLIEVEAWLAGGRPSRIKFTPTV